MQILAYIVLGIGGAVAAWIFVENFFDAWPPRLGPDGGPARVYASGPDSIPFEYR